MSTNTIMRKISFLALYATLAMLVLFGCDNKKSIIGKWRIVHVSSAHSELKDTFHFDLTDTAVLNKEIRDRLPASEWNNPLIKAAERCYLHLNSDSTFNIYDIGVFSLFTSNWLGSKYSGKWDVENDSILHLVYDNRASLAMPSKFLIEKMIPDSLTLLLKTPPAQELWLYHQIQLARE
jgi:hypothetical protein